MTENIVKGATDGYMFENLAIACYTALIGAANAVGDAETSAACERILVQEKAMAAWLLEHLPQIMAAFLAHSATPGLDAKV